MDQAVDPESSPKSAGWILLNIIYLSLLVHLWGVWRELPYIYEADEHIYVKAAVGIAASGNWDPGWFGNPGSTVIYPLAVIFHIWNAIAHHVPLFHPDPHLAEMLEGNFATLYLLGRYVSVLYGVLCVPVIFLLGRRVLGAAAGLMAAFFFALYPLAVAHAQLVRTDSAGAFFGLLGWWLCLRVYDQPTLRGHILAGIAIGLAVSSRYFMVLLLPFLAAVDLALLWKRPDKRQPRQVVLAGLGGLAAALIAFTLTSPFVFLDFTTALQNIRVEARTIHVGSDGLSPAGNLLYYLTRAIPDAVGWPQVILAVFGGVLALQRKQLKPALLLGFAALYLVGISLSPLHWARWTIQVLPILGLFAADAILTLWGRIGSWLKFSPRVAWPLVIVSALGISAQSAYHLILMDIQQSHPSTRLVARDWILKNLPPQSKIIQEYYAAYLTDTDYQVSEVFSVTLDHELSDYAAEGYQYLVVSSIIYDRYLQEPGRYHREVGIYQSLFKEGRLVKRIKPTLTRGGPEIRIYHLKPAP